MCATNSGEGVAEGRSRTVFWRSVFGVRGLPTARLLRERSAESAAAASSRSGGVGVLALAAPQCPREQLDSPGLRTRRADVGTSSEAGGRRQCAALLLVLPHRDSDAARASSDRARTSCLCTGCNGSGRVGLPLGRPTRQSVLPGVERALSRVAGSSLGERERVVAPIELSVVSRPWQQRGQRKRALLLCCRLVAVA